MHPKRKPYDLTPAYSSPENPLHAVPGAGPPSPALARDLREMLHFRDRALAGEVESRRPTVLAFDLPSTTFQEACLATLASLRGMTVIELVRDHLARGYEADLVALGREHCPERGDLFHSDDQDEASQSLVASVIKNVMWPLPLEADWTELEKALARDREGGQIRLELFQVLVDWLLHLAHQAIAHCVGQARAARRSARLAGDAAGAKALLRLSRNLRALL